MKVSYAAAFWRVFFWAEDQVMKLPPWSISAEERANPRPRPPGVLDYDPRPPEVEGVS